MKIQTWLKNAIQTLREAGIDSARIDCLAILEHQLKKPRDWLIAHSEETLNQAELTKLNKTVTQRADHIPLAYLIGSKEFYGRLFTVNNATLIPRPESEDIITLLLSTTSEETNTSPVLVDIGTGSGILAITAQLELPHSTVVATDISEPALNVAAQNAASLKAPVQFFNADLLALPDSVKPDIILANLPYVPDSLITSEEITKEPSLALFSGTDGLSHYTTLWQQISLLPHKPHVVVTESLASQHQQLQNLAHNAGYTLEKTLNLAQLFILQ